MAVAAIAPVHGPLAVLGAGTLLDLELHEPLGDVGEELPDDFVLRPLLNELGECEYCAWPSWGPFAESRLCKNNLRQEPRWPPSILGDRPRTPRPGTRSRRLASRRFESASALQSRRL